MRVVLITLLLLIAATVATPYWFGREAEKTYKNMVEEVSESANVTSTPKSYNRGWLNSAAETVFEIRSGTQKLVSLEVNNDISHGPIPLRELLKGNFQLKPVQAIINSTIKVTPEIQGEFTEFLSKLPPAEVITTVYIKGNGESQLSMPAFSYGQKGGNESVNWEGLNGRATFNPNFSEITAYMKSPGLRAKGPEFELSVKNVEFNSDLHSDTPNTYSPLGGVGFSVEHIDVRGKEPQNEQFSLKGLELVGSTEASGDSINSTHSLGFENFSTDGAGYGPGLYEIAIRNIDAAAWGKLQKMLQEIQNVNTSNDGQSQAVFTKIMEVLPDLLKKSPEIELTKLSLKTEKGEALGRAKITVDGGNPDAVNNPFLLLTAISAEADFTIPEPLLESILESFARRSLTDEEGKVISNDGEADGLAESAASGQLKQLVEQNILVVEGDNFKLSATYKQGQLKLNGRPIQIPLWN